MRTRAATLRRVLRPLTWLLFASVAGCVDLGAPVPDAPAGTIGGSITSAASADRALVVQAWASMPPRGPALAATTIAHPVFPQAYTLAGLAPGAIFLTARLADVDGAPAVLGSYPSVAEVSAVVLEPSRGLRRADFEIVQEGSRPAGAVVHAETRELAGTVRFGGTVRATDVLRGALYASYPPRGTPADLQILNVHAPSFPFAYRFANVRDGAYFTVFYLDRDGDSPFGPGPDDLVAWSLGPDGRPLDTPIVLGASRGGVTIDLPSR